MLLTASGMTCTCHPLVERGMARVTKTMKASDRIGVPPFQACYQAKSCPVRFLADTHRYALTALGSLNTLLPCFLSLQVVGEEPHCHDLRPRTEFDGARRAVDSGVHEPRKGTQYESVALPTSWTAYKLDPLARTTGTWLWVKNRHPFWKPWQMEPRIKTCGPWWFNFDPYPFDCKKHGL